MKENIKQFEDISLKMPVKKRVPQKYGKGLAFVLFLVISNFLSGQSTDTIQSRFTLPECIGFALKNQALVKQALIDEKITGKDIKIGLSGWYPQLEFDAGLQHYIQVPMQSGIPTTSANLSSGVFSATQTIFNSRLLYNARTSEELRKQASENTQNTKIDTYVDVTKAFFDVLLTEEQINVLDEAIHRLERNYKDAYNLYRNGLTDRTDYQRTQISLSNAQAQRKSAQESLKGKYAVLKQLIGLEPEKEIAVSYDTARYENEILTDTIKIPDYTRRIEYQQLQSALRLQNLDISFYKWSFLPSVSAFYNYNAQFYNDQFSELYNKLYPNSLAGLKLTFPLFQGMYRTQNIGRSKLGYQKLQYEMDYLKSSINSEYMLALGRYTGNLSELRTAKSNIVLAKDIFNTVKLQYEKGIKAYLEVIVSETDLRTSELNYLNALFQVLSSKLDLEKATGDILINL